MPIRPAHSREPSRVLQALAPLRTISLDEVGEDSLLSRLDRKFALPPAAAASLIEACGAEYRVLEVDGARLQRYRTSYFDTRDLAFYHAHHSGRARRAKVRLRSYVDSDLHFVELKERTVGGRTVKSRLRVPDAVVTTRSVEEAMRSLIAHSTSAATPTLQALEHGLEHIIDVEYLRATLVHEGGDERLTIDVALRMCRGVETLAYPDVAFIEVKQGRAAPSRALSYLRAHRAPQGTISKYCLAVALLVPRTKANRFKSAIARLHAVGAPTPFAVPA